jgi:hypothetical protein
MREADKGIFYFRYFAKMLARIKFCSLIMEKVLSPAQ